MTMSGTMATCDESVTSQYPIGTGTSMELDASRERARADSEPLIETFGYFVS
jgi:hypothetical protein